MTGELDGRFEDRLLTELKQVVAERATERSAGALSDRAETAHRPVRRRLVLAGALTATVLAALLVLALAPGTGTPAYAVSTSADGTVTVTANYLGDPSEANRALRRAGVSAVVLPAVAAADCPAQDRGRKVPGEAGGQGSTIMVTHMPTSTQVRVRWVRNGLPAGTLLVLSPQRDNTTGDMVMTIDEYYQPGPRCVARGVTDTVPVPIGSFDVGDDQQTPYVSPTPGS